MTANWRIVTTVLAIMLLVAFLIVATGSMGSNGGTITAVSTSKSIYARGEPVQIVLTVSSPGNTSGNESLPDAPVWVCDPSGNYAVINATFNGTCYRGVYDPEDTGGVYTAYASGPGSGPSAQFTVDPPASWPADSLWRTYVGASWAPCRNPYLGLNSSFMEIASGGNATIGTGPLDSIYCYYDAPGQTFFFRMRLQDDPWAGQACQAMSCWQVYLDINGDGQPEWLCELDTTGADAICTYYRAGIETRQCTGGPAYVQTDLAGYTRHTAASTSIDGQPLYFLDWQVPLSAFQSPGATWGNVSGSSVLRLYFGTSVDSNQIDRDWAFSGGRGEINFSMTSDTAPQTLYSGEYGLLYDTGSSPASSGSGVWHCGQSLTVSGSGWPVGNASVPYLDVRVVSPAGAIMNTTCLTYDRNSGCFSNVTIWQIPVDAAGGPGVYSIQVLDPMTGIRQVYDRFVLLGALPPLVQNVTVTPLEASPGSPVVIGAVVTDNCNVASVYATLGSENCVLDCGPAACSYTGTMTAPSASGLYVLTVTALDASGNTGRGTVVLSVSDDAQVKKTVTWDAVAGTYRVELDGNNPGGTTGSFVYDFVPSGFVATDFFLGGTPHIPDYNGAASIAGPETIGWNLGPGSSIVVTYDLSGETSLYCSTDTYVVGIDPLPGA